MQWGFTMIFFSKTHTIIIITIIKYEYGVLSLVYSFIK